MNIMIKKHFLLCFVVVGFLWMHGQAIAIDRQGRSSIETNKSRPKENKPSQSGVQRVQDRTTRRASKAIEPTGSARQQVKTQSDVDKALRKK